MPVGHVEKVCDAQSTTDAYTDSRIVEFKNFVRCGIWIKNTHGSNSLDWKVMGRYSVGDTDADWEEEKAEAALGNGATGTHEITAKNYAALKIQIKATVGGNQATCDSFMVKKRH